MIDLHNHILPGLDDGAADLAESLEIARTFVAEGVTTVVATPHLDPLNGRGAHADDVRSAVEVMQRVLDDTHVNLRLLAGQEIYLTPEVPELLEQGVALSLAGGPYVLVELPFGQRPLYLDDTVLRLQLAGRGVVLAHPERYSFIQREPGVAQPLVARGVVMQVTAPSILGQYGPKVKKTAEDLLRLGLASLVSSDRHHPDQQRGLDAAFRRVAEMADERVAQLLLEENPRRIVSGEGVVEPEPFPSKSRWPRLFGR